MLEILKNVFAGGAVQSIEKIATEWIETDKEKAEAQAIMIKTLDPNGLMRRDLSNRVTMLYTVYMFVTLGLIIAESFGIGGMNGDKLAVSVATEKITDLFTPITALFGVIVSASFGVNYINTAKGK